MKIDRTPRSYLRAEDFDALARQNVQLMTELWIVKDRLAVLESMLEEKSLVDRQKLNDIEPAGALAEELDRDRSAYLDRIMGVDPRERTVEALRNMSPTRKG